MAAIISPIMSITEICEYLRISRKTLSQLIKVGKIPYFRIATYYRFNRREIDEWRTLQERLAVRGLEPPVDDAARMMAGCF